MIRRNGAWLVLMIALLGWFGCSSAPAPVVVPATVAVAAEGDDARLVSRTEFITGVDNWQGVGTVTAFQVAGNRVEFTLTSGKKAEISFPGPLAYRLRFNPTGDYSRDNSYAVIKPLLASTEVTASEKDGQIVLSTGALTLQIAKAGFLITVLRNGKVIARDTKGIQVAGNRIAAFRQLAPEDRIYGLGEKGGPLLKNGQSLKMWNTDAYRYRSDTDPIYMDIPWIVSASPAGTWGLLFDNTYQSFFNFGQANEGELYFGATGGEMNYWFFADRDLPSLTKSYADLTGKMELPPRWSLGYQQSRYSYMSQDEVLELAKNFRDKKIPADVIYLDIDFMDQKRDFSFDPEAFPEAGQMLKTLRDQGFKTITIIDPGIAIDDDYGPFASGTKADVFMKNAKGELITGTVWPGMCAFPDFTKPETRVWWGEQYKYLFDLGIEAIWNDMNEPSVFSEAHKTLPWDARSWDFGTNSLTAKTHNVYGQQMARATFEGLNKLRPNLRNFLVSRAGYAGSQRYGTVWTGDNTANWEHLKLNLTMVLNLGLSGMPMTGADIGGYASSPDQELFTRWMQLGALIPFYRNHSEKNSEPKEPWMFGDDYLPYIKSAIELRYRLLPYFYDLVRAATVTGNPVVRPLFYDYPADTQTYDLQDEFMIGDGLLAAPVLTSEAKTREVYFPAGQVWFDWFTGKEYVGGKTYTIDTPIDKVPLFARGGAVIPTQEVEQWVGEKASNPIELRIYPGGSGSHNLYQDDGLTKNYQKGDYLETKWSYSTTGRDMMIDVASVNQALAYRAKDKYVLIRLSSVKRPLSVLIDGKPITLYGDSGGVTESDTSAAWYEHDNSLLMKVYSPERDQHLTLRY